MHRRVCALYEWVLNLVVRDDGVEIPPYLRCSQEGCREEGLKHCLCRHPYMEFFLDTADVDEIREIASWGILDGVTTNPSLIKKSGRDFKTVVAEIASICDGPISAEVTALKNA